MTPSSSAATCPSTCSRRTSANTYETDEARAPLRSPWRLHAVAGSHKSPRDGGGGRGQESAHVPRDRSPVSDAANPLPRPEGRQGRRPRETTRRMASRMTRLRASWEYLRGTYWAVPSAMAVAAVGLSVGMIQLDEAATASLLDRLSW